MTRKKRKRKKGQSKTDCPIFLKYEDSNRFKAYKNMMEKNLPVYLPPE